MLRRQLDAAAEDQKRRDQAQDQVLATAAAQAVATAAASAARQEQEQEAFRSQEASLRLQLQRHTLQRKTNKNKLFLHSHIYFIYPSTILTLSHQSLRHLLARLICVPEQGLVELPPEDVALAGVEYVKPVIREDSLASIEVSINRKRRKVRICLFEPFR